MDIRNHVTVTTITSSLIISAKTNSDVSNYCGPVGMTSDSHGDDPGSIPDHGRKIKTIKKYFQNGKCP